MKKLFSKQQEKLIQLLYNLLSNGFNLTEVIAFLRKSQLLLPVYVTSMEASLLKGNGLADMLAALGYSDAVMTQINLADKHGNIKLTLEKIQDYLSQFRQIKRKTIEAVTYPIILLGFLVVIMLGLRHYLIPQLESQNALTDLLLHLPHYFLGFCLLLLSLIGSFYLYARSCSRLRLFSQLSYYPIIGVLLRQYLTAYYAREWGNLIGQGLELITILEMMSNEKSQLMRELAKDIKQGLLAGQSFHQRVAAYPFFKKELSLMIEYGDIKSKLGRELDIYAQESWETFFSQLNRATQWIQPIIFLLVAVIIVMIYAAILLPIYQHMGDVF
ncbi:TPA: type II secretion system F family protein [Streptococcus equi subsp. zooepidemicus]|nr:type II secretion system F family protein [Streptococcus equi subsp. zooepidemicus]HEL0627775.1 type II secretion system F family protein [Streptococcus equi subsp. zooepidemicus]HEL0724192.1 type II secretion system F family protein [Streptococcus equi subsp. zooepidemicus]